MRPIYVSRALAAASGNNICLSQTPGGAGNMILNGASVVAGIAVLDAQRHVLFTPVADETGHNFTITGTDENGMVISEVLAGTNATPFSSILNYKTVTSIAISAAATGAITVGTNGVGESVAIPLDLYLTPFNPTLAFEVLSGALNVDVQYTNDDPFAAAFLTTATVWTAISSLTGKSAYADASLSAPVSAVRLKTNSGTGTGRLIVRQPGGHGVS